ncbi:MIOREX complex component [Trichinella spiralis]|uniref:MIOREX complex component n=1 Tax=Trichinella spiralis TaxID=6334 RepID=A0ABR3K5T3_TRISP
MVCNRLAAAMFSSRPEIDERKATLAVHLEEIFSHLEELQICRWFSHSRIAKGVVSDNGMAIFKPTGAP